MTSSQKPAQSSLDNYKGMMDERAALTTQKSAIEARIKVLDADLRPALLGRGELIHNGYSFKVDPAAGRVTYDTKAMIADGMDLSAYEKVGSPTTRFNVKPIQQL